VKLFSLFAVVLATIPLTGAVKSAAVDAPWSGAVAVGMAEINAALEQAAIYSRYSMPWVDRPEVYVVSDDVLHTMACGSEPCPSLRAVTLWEKQHRIYLSAAIAPNRRNDVLLHEIVHWLQMRSGWMNEPFNCPDSVAHEVEAYAVQYAYRVRNQHEQINFWIPSYFCPVVAVQ
jgi:hypothetical protein